MQLSPKAYLANAHSRIAASLVDLQFCIASADGPQPEALAIALDQQAGDIIEQLLIAIAQIRSAKARVAEKALRAAEKVAA